MMALLLQLPLHFALAVAAPPNVVVLLSDDAGYADFGFQKCAAADMAQRTPNIDRIAREGVVLTDFHTTASVCSPSRAGMLTGRYQQEFGHENNLPPRFMEAGVARGGRSLAERMKDAGYATGYIGKWHLGYRPEDHPNRRGWDWFYGLLQGSRPYLPQAKPTKHQVIQENGTPVAEASYVTDALGDAAVRFLREHKAAPFFLLVSFTAPHGPLQPRPADTESSAFDGIADKERRKYAMIVHAMDQNVGKVLAAIDDLGLAENTIVMFTNDNGGQTKTGASNGPLRGRKGELTEGGVRVPAAIRWPGHIPAGSTCAVPSTTLDLAPTLLAAAGSADARDRALDGQSLLTCLEGGEAPAERTLYWRQDGSKGPRAARRGKWKLLQADRNTAAALYDLSQDPSESKDLFREHEDVAKQLTAQLDAWEAALEEPFAKDDNDTQESASQAPPKTQPAGAR